MSEITMRININELQFKFKFRDDPEMPATMVLVVGQFEIRGFRVLKSKFEENATRYYIKPPSNKTSRGWVDIFWVNAPKDWSLLEKLVLEQFSKEQEEKLLKEFGHAELPV